MINLNNKTAIITGGSSGIGAAISLTFANLGANIVMIDWKEEKEAQDIIAKLHQIKAKVLFIKADVSNYAEAQKAIEKSIQVFGKIDILVNNAGINKDGVVWKMTEEQWDSVINVDLKGSFNYIRAVSPIFKEQNSGKILNITSINGLRGKFGQANYSAAKAGVIGLTKTVAKELGKYNVNVNAIAPGLIETEMMKNADEIVRKQAMADVILNRIGQPEDIANTAAFLCCELAKHITGEIIKVDGGQYI